MPASAKMLLKPLSLVCAMALAVACTEQSPAQKAIQAQVGKSASTLTVKTLDGELQTLADPFATNGKPIVLNVWATWCTPCLAEMPTLDALGKQGQYTVIAIATDSSATTVKEFLRKQNWGSGMQVWHDPNGLITRDQLGALGLPSTYVLTPSLTITLAYAGPQDWSSPNLKATLTQSLQGQ